MKSILASCVFFLLPIVSAADESEKLQTLCAFSGAELFDASPVLSEASPSARAAMGWITSAVSLNPNFEVFEGDSVPSVAFAAIQNGKRIIVYDAKKFHWTTSAVRWRDVVVIAHEIGHHLAGHILTPSEDAHARELEADQFAGYAVSLLGGTLDQALSVIAIFPEEDSDTHPAREKRRNALTLGWQRGERIKRREQP